MTAERWQQIEALYHAALEHPEEKRAAYLDRACAKDLDLRGEVESLLERDKPGVFDYPAWEALIENGAKERATTLHPGQQLGGYRIIGPLGVGGMGEVYRAHDTRLDRDTAIKVLPAALARDPERLARFAREAKVLASLNHPNIAQIYGVEDSAGVPAIAMELVPGEPVKGPLPLETVIGYARQLAAALEAAHERGIIHRDLKPANIMVTPEGILKVLDFGIARPTGPADSQHTRTGIILGTAAYMAPEQARGKALDKRVDIWAFGVLLYELSTGKRLFAGETATDILAAVVSKEPDLTALPKQLQRLVRNCIEKDPKNRLRDIGDWNGYLDDSAIPTTASKPRPRPLLGWAVAASILTAAGLGAFFLRTKPALRPEPLNIQLRLPQGVYPEATGDVILSPDGKHAAFPGFSPDGWQVYIQDFDGSEARGVPGSRVSANSPPMFWSPDSRYVVFSSNSQRILKVEAATGLLSDLCEKPEPMIGGAWNRDGVVILGGLRNGLWRVPAGGGTPVPLTRLDKKRGETAHQLPMFLPDQKHFLYHANSTDPTQAAIYAASLDDGPNTAPRRIVATRFNGRFVQDGEGHSWLLYLNDGALVAQPFDPGRLTLTGSPQQIPLRIGTAYDTALFSAERDVLLYRSTAGDQERRFTWFDLNSRQMAGTVGEPGVFGLFAQLSPDETRLAYAKSSPFGRLDIWTMDLARGASTRLTFEGEQDNSDDPVWSPDGREIVFARNVTHTAAGWKILRRPADGSGTEEVLLETAQSVRPLSWTKDGKFLLFESSSDAAFGKSSLSVLPMQKGSTPFPFTVPGTRFRESDGRFSPDGRYIAYQSEDTGKSEVYVRAFSPESTAQNGARWLVSDAGGHAPAWSPDGRKLYWRLATFVWEADIDTAHGFHAGTPRKILELPEGMPTEYVIINRGRILLPRAVDPRPGQALNLVFNWRSWLK